MRTLGNIIWFIFGGLFASIAWVIAGVLFYITIIGIPFGRQAFKFAGLVLFPFKKDVRVDFDKHPIANIIWLILFGWEMALGYVFLGAIYCITIIGIPFGLQWFKFSKLALLPFGAKVIKG